MPAAGENFWNRSLHLQWEIKFWEPKKQGKQQKQGKSVNLAKNKAKTGQSAEKQGKTGQKQGALQKQGKVVTQVQRNMNNFISLRLRECILVNITHIKV